MKYRFISFAIILLGFAACSNYIGDMNTTQKRELDGVVRGQTIKDNTTTRQSGHNKQIQMLSPKETLKQISLKPHVVSFPKTQHLQSVPRVRFRINKVPEGQKVVSFFPSGAVKQVWSMKRQPRKPLQADGLQKVYFPNGALKYIRSYTMGKKDGVWTELYPNGAKRRLRSYKQGIPHGPWNTWFSNGQIESTGTYQQGRREGAWMFYTKKGHLLKKLRFVKGKIHDTTLQRLARIVKTFK